MTNSYRRALSDCTPFCLFDPQDEAADKPLIPGVERVFRIGSRDFEFDGMADDKEYVKVTAAEAQSWTDAYRLFLGFMMRLEEQAEEETARYRQQMAEIDRRRRAAWAEYEPVHNKIQQRLT